MGTTGSVDVNLESFERIINESTETGSAVTEEMSQQGELIGLGVGLFLAFVSLTGAALIALGVVVSILVIVKKYRKM